MSTDMNLVFTGNVSDSTPDWVDCLAEQNEGYNMYISEGNDIPEEGELLVVGEILEWDALEWY